MKILMIEDEKKVAQALKKGLESEYYKVELGLSGDRRDEIGEKHVKDDDEDEKDKKPENPQ